MRPGVPAWRVAAGAAGIPRHPWLGSRIRVRTPAAHAGFLRCRSADAGELHAGRGALATPSGAEPSLLVHRAPGAVPAALAPVDAVATLDGPDLRVRRRRRALGAWANSGLALPSAARRRGGRALGAARLLPVAILGGAKGHGAACADSGPAGRLAALRCHGADGDAGASPRAARMGGVRDLALAPARGAAPVGLWRSDAGPAARAAGPAG